MSTTHRGILWTPTQLSHSHPELTYPPHASPRGEIFADLAATARGDSRSASWTAERSGPRLGAGTSGRTRSRVLDSWIDACSWEAVIQQIANWARQRESRYVCLCNVHSIVTAWRDPEFASVVNEADLALPDGAPVALSLRLEGHREQRRINGPDLTWRLLAEAERSGVSVFFYGSSQDTLDQLRSAIKASFPGLLVADMVSPPYRELSAEEDAQHVQQINDSGAGVLFVGLGCPKQERWMAAHEGRIRAVMIGVGAALDYHSGVVKRAPAWMQHHGLEWFHRMATEPRRLVWRYLNTNMTFVVQMLIRAVRRSRGTSWQRVRLQCAVAARPGQGQPDQVPDRDPLVHARSADS
jgi:N-acetylglucosaminyldiphosphoundecaprenol N-acetyl-beta-D-mannosaminyltransferase